MIGHWLNVASHVSAKVRNFFVPSVVDVIKLFFEEFWKI